MALIYLLQPAEEEEGFGTTEGVPLVTTWPRINDIIRVAQEKEEDPDNPESLYRRAVQFGLLGYETISYARCPEAQAAQQHERCLSPDPLPLIITV